MLLTNMMTSPCYEHLERVSKAISWKAFLQNGSNFYPNWREGSLYLHIIIPLRIKAMNTRRVLQLTSAEQGGPLQSNWPSNFQGLQSQLPFPLKTHDLPKCFISRYG
ncbi:uncharacterized protein LOC144307985 isoform X1 [Canis aureus]